MLLEDRFGQSGFEQQSVKDAFNFRDTIAQSNSMPSASSGFSSRHTVHVVAEEAQQRATMARIIFASGHHAEVYNDASELVDHRPSEGILLVHESGQLGAAMVCQTLAKHGLWLPVVGFGVEVDACRIIAGIKAGALDYIIGPVSVETLLTKLEGFAQEAKSVFETHIRRAGARLNVAKLSDRERQVLDLLVEGHSNKEMARDLGISPRTVEIHRMKMMGKLGAASSAHAVRIQIDAHDG
jgi:two-component system, LuxR family, response regulator FixJ